MPIRSLAAALGFALATVVGEGETEVQVRPAVRIAEGPSPAGAISVRLKRPFRPGQVFSYAAVGRTYRQTVVSTSGSIVKESVRGLQGELAAAMEVDSVRADGRPLALTLRVFRLVVREGFLPAEEGGNVDAGEQPLEPGTELRIEYPPEGAGVPDISAVEEGVELSDGVVDALRLVLPAPAGTRDDDHLFGNAERLLPGAVWQPDLTEVAAALREGGVEVASEDLAGVVRLVRHDPEAGEYEVAVRLRGDRAGVALPEGYVTREGTLDTGLTLRLPEKETEPLLAESAEYSLRSHALGKEGERLMMVDVVLLQTRNARYRRVGADP